MADVTKGENGDDELNRQFQLLKEALQETTKRNFYDDDDIVSQLAILLRFIIPDVDSDISTEELDGFKEYDARTLLTERHELFKGFKESTTTVEQLKEGISAFYESIMGPALPSRGTPPGFNPGVNPGTGYVNGEIRPARRT